MLDRLCAASPMTIGRSTFPVTRSVAWGGVARSPEAGQRRVRCKPAQSTRAGWKRKTTVRTVRARWVEAEGLRLKQMGMSYEAIATHIAAVGRGLKPPVIALLGGVTFPTIEARIIW
jgi:hypothetical protein